MPCTFTSRTVSASTFKIRCENRWQQLDNLATPPPVAYDRSPAPHPSRETAYVSRWLAEMKSPPGVIST